MTIPLAAIAKTRLCTDKVVVGGEAGHFVGGEVRRQVGREVGVGEVGGGVGGRGHGQAVLQRQPDFRRDAGGHRRRDRRHFPVV